MLRPMVVTAIVLIAAGVVKVYDLILALTSGGPIMQQLHPLCMLWKIF